MNIFPSMEDLRTMGLRKYMIHRVKIWTMVFVLVLLISAVCVVSKCDACNPCKDCDLDGTDECWMEFCDPCVSYLDNDEGEMKCPG